MKNDERHVQIVSADISSEAMTGMVIFRPHYVLRDHPQPGAAAQNGPWFALPPGEVRSFARALLDAADTVERKARLQLGAKVV
jgi:hypothetical protein